TQSLTPRVVPFQLRAAALSPGRVREGHLRRAEGRTAAFLLDASARRRVEGAIGPPRCERVPGQDLRNQAELFCPRRIAEVERATKGPETHPGGSSESRPARVTSGEVAEHLSQPRRTQPGRPTEEPTQ